MSDAHLRDLERRWLATRSLADQAAWIQARLRLAALAAAEQQALAELCDVERWRTQPSPEVLPWLALRFMGALLAVAPLPACVLDPRVFPAEA